MSIDEILAHVEENEMNVTLSGGDPLYQMPQMAELCRRLQDMGVTVWCYTGYTYEQVLADPKLAPILDHIDVMVDSPFIEAQRDIGLRFRGSANQRLIDIKRSKGQARPVIWTDD